MKPQLKPGRKTVLSAAQEALAAQWVANLPAWADRAAELAAQLRPFSAGEREAFFALLQAGAGESAFPLFETLTGIDEGLDAALIRGCGHAASSRAVEFLVRWAGKNPSREIAKGIRKSLFRLQSRGLPVPDLEDPSPGVFRPPQTEPAQGYVSAVDAGGARAVWLGLPQPPRGILLVSSILRDTEGILKFTVYESSRKKFHEFMGRARSEAPWDVVDCDPDYCAALIHEAHQLQDKQGKTPNPDYLKLKGLWGPPPSPPLRPLIYRYLNEEEIKARTDLLNRSPSLFETASFQLWFLEKEEIAKCLKLLEEAGRSRIILAPQQQESRFFEIYRQAVREIFGEKRRLLFRRRLEEMAYVLLKKGDENSARVSLAAGVALAAEDTYLSPHPFLLGLVMRTASFLQEEDRREKEKGKGGLIIQP